jgi:hypothetical protein
VRLFSLLFLMFFFKSTYLQNMPVVFASVKAQTSDTQPLSYDVFIKLNTYARPSAEAHNIEVTQMGGTCALVHDVAHVTKRRLRSHLHKILRHDEAASQQRTNKKSVLVYTCSLTRDYVSNYLQSTVCSLQQAVDWSRL